ncbi:MAG: hypothetical protein QM680_07260 [Luteolibacter sp.]
MNPLRSLNPERIAEDGFGVTRPLSDHPEALRNMLLRGGHHEWCEVIERTQSEPEFRVLIRQVLQTIPYPQKWDYPGNTDPEGDSEVESSARPLFENLLHSCEVGEDVQDCQEDHTEGETARADGIIQGNWSGIDLRQIPSGKRLKPYETEIVGGVTMLTAPECLRVKAWLLATRSKLRDYSDVAALSDCLGHREAVSVLSELNDYFTDTTSTTPVQNFIEACWLKPSDWDDFKGADGKGEFPSCDNPEAIQSTCRNLAGRLFPLLCKMSPHPFPVGDPPYFVQPILMNEADRLRYWLALAVVHRIRESPEEAERVIGIVRRNISRLAEHRQKTWGDAEWLEIINTRSPEEVASILEEKSDEGQRLRSNFRGYGIMPDSQRREIIEAANGLRPFSSSLLMPRAFD